MSLINDALRRASKASKDRPPEAPTGSGMEPVPPSKNSRSNAMLGVLTLIVLLLAGWFFWQWWTMRQKAKNSSAANSKIVQSTVNKTAPTNDAAAPKPTGTITFVPEKKPAPVAATTTAQPVTPSVPATESTATTTTTAPPAATETTPASTSLSATAQPQIVTPVPPSNKTAAAPVYVDEHIALPVDLTVSAIMFNKTDPHALINGQLYGVGDMIQGGVAIKAIERNRVVFEWNGHIKILMVGE